MAKKKTIDKEKSTFFDKYIITFFWLLFLLSSIPTLIFQVSSQKQYDEEMSKYGKTVLIFDHAEDYYDQEKGKILVYKYDVDGEIYTYRSKEPTKDIPKEGTEYEYYYDKERPQEIIEKDNKTGNYISSIGTIVFFAILVILSIIGAKIDGVGLSMILSFIPLCLLFVVVSIAMLCSSVYILVNGGELVLVFFFAIMGLCFTPLTIFAEVKLFKEVIEYFKNDKKRK